MKRKENDLQITINDFRAIKEADIALNGITVLAGINGSGKSTVSQLLYFLLHEMNNYNGIVFRKLYSSIRPYLNVLENIVLSSVRNFDDYRKYSNLLRVNSFDDLQIIQENVTSVCKAILSFKEEEGKRLHSENSINRYRRMLINTIDADENMSFEDALKNLEDLISKEINTSKEYIRKRPSSLLNESFEESFGKGSCKKVTISEYGDSIFSEDRRTVPIPHFVSNLFYIDTPYAIDDVHSQNREDLYNALRASNSRKDSPIASYIERQVIKGQASYEKTDNYSGFFFQDKRGNKFRLSLAATGIKSFSIIQLLLRNGKIDEDTLLILDEPESHLHPQWIVDYARMIVLLHKTVGTKFLISSHSPDMVSAIRYIADSEKCTDNLEFYTTRQAYDGTGRFNFISTGLDIDPIFKSFNKSYERLNHYLRGHEQEE